MNGLAHLNGLYLAKKKKKMTKSMHFYIVLLLLRSSVQIFSSARSAHTWKQIELRGIVSTAASNPRGARFKHASKGPSPHDFSDFSHSLRTRISTRPHDFTFLTISLCYNHAAIRLNIT